MKTEDKAPQQGMPKVFNFLALWDLVNVPLSDDWEGVILPTMEYCIKAAKAIAEERIKNTDMVAMVISSSNFNQTIFSKPEIYPNSQFKTADNFHDQFPPFLFLNLTPTEISKEALVQAILPTILVLHNVFLSQNPDFIAERAALIGTYLESSGFTNDQATAMMQQAYKIGADMAAIISQIPDFASKFPLILAREIGNIIAFNVQQSSNMNLVQPLVHPEVYKDQLREEEIYNKEIVAQAQKIQPDEALIDHALKPRDWMFADQVSSALEALQADNNSIVIPIWNNNGFPLVQSDISTKIKRRDANNNLMLDKDGDQLYDFVHASRFEGKEYPAKLFIPYNFSGSHFELAMIELSAANKVENVTIYNHIDANYDALKTLILPFGIPLPENPTKVFGCNETNIIGCADGRCGDAVIATARLIALDMEPNYENLSLFYLQEEGINELPKDQIFTSLRNKHYEDGVCLKKEVEEEEYKKARIEPDSGRIEESFVEYCHQEFLDIMDNFVAIDEDGDPLENSKIAEVILAVPGTKDVTFELKFSKDKENGGIIADEFIDREKSNTQEKFLRSIMLSVVLAVENNEGYTIKEQDIEYSTNYSDERQISQVLDDANLLRDKIQIGKSDKEKCQIVHEFIVEKMKDLFKDVKVEFVGIIKPNSQLHPSEKEPLQSTEKTKS